MERRPNRGRAEYSRKSASQGLLSEPLSPPPHPFFAKNVISPMSLAKYGFAPRVKQPDLSVEETLLLNDLTDILQVIDQETELWLYTNGKATLKALKEVHSLVLSLTTALSSDDFRFERLYKIVKENDLKVIALAIRCPKTDNEELKQEKKKTRQKIQLLLDRVLSGMEAISKTKSSINFANMKIIKDEIPILIQQRRRAVQEVAEEAFVEEAVQVDQNPPGMYQ